MMAVILSLPLPLALTKVTALVVCGLTGVNGRVLLLLSLPPFDNICTGGEVCKAVVCWCCFGDVAGVKMPKLTRLGRLILMLAPFSFKTPLVMVALLVGD